MCSREKYTKSIFLIAYKIGYLLVHIQIHSLKTYANIIICSRFEGPSRGMGTFFLLSSGRCWLVVWFHSAFIMGYLYNSKEALDCSLFYHAVTGCRSRGEILLELNRLMRTAIGYIKMKFAALFLIIMTTIAEKLGNYALWKQLFVFLEVWFCCCVLENARLWY